MPVTLIFTSFSLEVGFDWVKVYDGVSVSSAVLGEFSGSKLPPRLHSQRGELSIEFTSDATISLNGFEAQWSTNGIAVIAQPPTANTAVEKHCDGVKVLREPKGTITDGDDDYLPNSHCRWIIMSDIPNDSITIRFIFFDLEQQRDFIKIYDGASASPELLLVQLTGRFNPLPVRSTSGTMLIEFLSDMSIERAGFEATYTSRTVYFGVSAAPSWMPTSMAIEWDKWRPTGLPTSQIDGVLQRRKAQQEDDSPLLTSQGAIVLLSAGALVVCMIVLLAVWRQIQQYRAHKPVVPVLYHDERTASALSQNSHTERLPGDDFHASTARIICTVDQGESNCDE
jgi:hypothetical protein